MTPNIEEKQKKRLSPAVAFSIFFLIGFGAWGTVNSFWPVYFNSFNYSNTQIGILSAVGPFSAMFGLLFWGARADRARFRNNVLFLICAILGVTSQLYLLNGAFFYTLALTVIFMFCFSPMTTVGESMFLECVQRGEIKYGRSRLWGSVGLALIPLLPGLVISKWGIRSVFPAHLLLMALAIIIALQLKKSPGGQRASGKKTSILEMRHDKEFVGLTCFLFLLHVTLGFYYSFFPVYMDNLGATNLIGLNNMAQFAAEILLVCIIVPLLRRFGFARLHIFAFMLTAVRLLLIGVIRSPVLLLVVNLVGGSGYSLCMLMFSFFSLRAPSELRVSALMFSSIVSSSLSRFLGSMLGGALSDMIGIPSVFFYAGLFDIILLAAFILWLRKSGSLRDPVLI